MKKYTTILMALLLTGACQNDTKENQDKNQSEKLEQDTTAHVDTVLQNDVGVDENKPEKENDNIAPQSVGALKNNIEQLSIPVTLGKESDPSDSWLHLTDESKDSLDIKRYMKDTTASVYVIGKLKLEGSWGIVYHFQYIDEPTNDDNYDLLRSETVLVMYTEHNEATSSILLGGHELSGGYARIKSPSKITHVYRTEMEDIRIKVIHYTLDSGQYTSETIDFKAFNGDQEGSEKAEAYIVKQLKL